MKEISRVVMVDFGKLVILKLRVQLGSKLLLPSSVDNLNSFFAKVVLVIVMHLRSLNLEVAKVTEQYNSKILLLSYIV